MTLKKALDLYRAGLVTVTAVQNKERVTLYILKGQTK
jgi:aspartate 1-decarboxylase